MNTTSNRRAVECAVARLAQAWNNHDSEEYARNFTEYGELVNSFGHRLIGRVPIARFYASLFATVLNTTTQSFELLDTKRVSPGVEMASVNWRLIGPGAVDPVVDGERRGIAQLIFVREDGQWLIAMMQTTQTSSTGFTEQVEDPRVDADALYDQLEM